MSRPSRLDDAEIARRLDGLAGWERAEGKVVKRFRFADFSEAFAFMTRVALAAEQRDHHPDWSNVWRDVTVAWTTHAAGGITELDFEMAARCDELAAARGPKDQ